MVAVSSKHRRFVYSGCTINLTVSLGGNKIDRGSVERNRSSVREVVFIGSESVDLFGIGASIRLRSLASIREIQSNSVN